MTSNEYESNIPDTPENPNKNTLKHMLTPEADDLEIELVPVQNADIDALNSVEPAPNKKTKPFPINIKFVSKYEENEEYTQKNKRIRKRKMLYWKNYFIFLYKQNIKTILKILFVLTLTAYIIAACVINIRMAVYILVLYLITLLVFVYKNIKYFFGKTILNAIKPLNSAIKKYEYIILGIFLGIFAILFVLFVSLQMQKDFNHWMALLGYFLVIFVVAITSKNLLGVNLKTIGTSIFLHVLILYVLSRLPFFSEITVFLSNKMKILSGFAIDSSAQLFGRSNTHYLAFQIFPILIFFSSIINLLYYIGFMGFITISGSYLLSKLLNVSKLEAINTFSNIFLGNIEAPLLIKPFLPFLSKSEYTLVLCGGFSSLAGGVLAIYIQKLDQSNHLLNCSVIAPFATIALCKLSFPEKKNYKKDFVEEEIIKNKEKNFIHAISEGAFASIGLVAGVAVSLIAFLSMQLLANELVGYFASLVGYESVTLNQIFSYIFYPISLFIGIEAKDRLLVSQLLGTKLFLNEFIAYDTLEKLFTDNLITVRSYNLAIYLLGSFANFGTMGSAFGAMRLLVPTKAEETAKIMPRAFFVGFIVSVFNAAAAGFIMQ